MSRPPSKKGSARASPERRRRERKSALKKRQNACFFCTRPLHPKDSALFVEEEVGRIFCTEECITRYFTPEVERLEKEYKRILSREDLTGEEKEALAHLRWLTLEESDETWHETTSGGDLRYTLISEFQPGENPIWYICICLFLRGDPSFLFLAFPTKDAAMVDYYRKGDRMERTRHTVNKDKKGESSDQTEVTDGLAEPWTEEETLRAQVMQDRRKDDIPTEDYALYQSCVDETLETPDEVWSLKGVAEETRRMYHFIRHYPEERPAMWFIIVARETEDDEQIEIVDAFPTRDQKIMEFYRRGEQEVGHAGRPSSSQLVH